ncbi:MAG: glutamate-1-semialdehyde 2,1-aminomutase [Lachnospiraceae bacterium]|nr:glutamate-1-semialdehyde 2,1-aminomutase [Lachnospiraceae bacterium]MDE6981080.1 glutamate-1-semialdehyde 2,1-aminomutase [Lachnospiraceae bacterium]
MKNSQDIFNEGKKYIPGGVNSPVRAFQSIGSTPPVIKRGDKAVLWDEDGNSYIDFVCSWGPMVLGHNHPKVYESVVNAAKNGLSFGALAKIEVEMAKLIASMVPSVEMVRMVNSGTEAVMSAIRAARGYTRRDKIIKFDGCYHGHSDGLLVAAGSGVMTSGVPDCAGVPKSVTGDTLTAPYNHLEEVEDHMKRQGEEIAAVVVEPVAANMGVVLPQPGFLEGLRKLCDAYGAVLIFDEVITGFRLAPGGAQEYFHVMPDLTTMGKIIGAGMPVGAYGGKREIMETVAPVGPVYQAGTLSGNPVAMAAGLAQLGILKEHPEYYSQLNEKGDEFFREIEKIISKSGKNCRVNHIGSLGSIFFAQGEVLDYVSAKTADTEAFARYARYMVSHGIYVAPSQFEAMFLSLAHTKEQLSGTLAVIQEGFSRGF